MRYKVVKQAIIFLSIFVFSVSNIYGSDTVKLNVKVKEVADEYLVCDLSYSFNLEKNDSIDLYVINLPFKKDVIFNIISNEPNLCFTHGYNISGKGVAIFNSLNEAFDFKANSQDVKIPYHSNSNELKGNYINLDLTNNELFNSLSGSNIKTLWLNEIVVETKSLLDSKPIFELSKEGAGKFHIKLNKQNKSIYFVVPMPPESYFNIFIIAFIFTIIVGCFGSLRIIEGKMQSIIGGGISFVLLIYLGYLFFTKVIPTDFNKDLDLIAIVGSVSGLSLGVFFISLYNLITIYAIDRAQNP